MHEIRKNNKKEEVYLKGFFDMPKIIKTLYIIFFCFFISIGVPAIFLQLFEVAVFGCLLALGVYILYKIHSSAIRKGEFLVTNKAVNGLTAGILFRKRYNYRLDEIENIEISSGFGIHTIVLHFSQGKMGSTMPVTYGKGIAPMTGTNILTVMYLVNVQEVYNKLSELLKSIKNEKDTAVEIEMKKIETEERKTTALERFAAKLEPKEVQHSNEDIDKLEKLARLKEKGLITEEEYNQKKEELLRKI